MSIELVMPSNHLVLCHPLLLLIQSIRVFSGKHLRDLFNKIQSLSFPSLEILMWNLPVECASL